MTVRPITPALLVDELAARVASSPAEPWLRVAIDGAAAARPDELGGALVDPLRVGGRFALHVSTQDFLRPASLRLERGRTDPNVFYDGWFDVAGLRRELLDPLGPGGTGRVLPSLWDAVADRATRADYVTVPPGGVVIVSGPLLLGAGLPFDLTVHCALSPAALARRTAPDSLWTLPAFDRYEEEVGPASLADVVVRMDDPRRPALVEAG